MLSIYQCMLSAVLYIDAMNWASNVRDLLLTIYGWIKQILIFLMNI
jgi:hypothetical protein